MNDGKTQGERESGEESDRGRERRRERERGDNVAEQRVNPLEQCLKLSSMLCNKMYELCSVVLAGYYMKIHPPISRGRHKNIQKG